MLVTSGKNKWPGIGWRREKQIEKVKRKYRIKDNTEKRIMQSFIMQSFSQTKTNKNHRNKKGRNSERTRARMNPCISAVAKS